MILPDDLPSEPGDDAVDAALAHRAQGALALAGIAAFVVVAIWFAFYLFVFVPRASAP